MGESWVWSVVRKTPWRKEWQPTTVFLPGEFHNQKSMAGYNLWNCKESDMTEGPTPDSQYAHASADNPFINLYTMTCYKYVIFSFQNSQIRSVAQSCLTLCDTMDYSTPGFLVLHYLPEFVQTHVHWVGDAIEPSHPLLPSSPFTFNLSQHQGLFQWVSILHQVAKISELQLRWIFRIDFL